MTTLARAEPLVATVLVAVLLGAWPVPLARLGVTRGPAGGVEDGIPAGGLPL